MLWGGPCVRVLLFTLACLGGGAWGEAAAQGGRAPAGAVPPTLSFKRCLSQKELENERLVRHGVYLREGAGRCDEYVSGTWKQWEDLNTTLGPRMKQATDARKRMFDKEFGKDGDKVRTYFDGRLVTYYRHFPLTDAYCVDVDKMLKDINQKGWSVYKKQAKVIFDNVMMDYRSCQ